MFCDLQVMNLGPSKALNAKVEIDIPQVLVPYPDRLIRVTDLQVRWEMIV